MKINSEQEMLNFGETFAKNTINKLSTSTGGRAWGTPSRASARMGENARTGPVEAITIELIGDVGSGKTTFTRGLAKGLGIKDPITSPSFTISKSYALENGGHLIHYDFYRLPDPGLMLDDLSENLQDPKNIIVIEWGKSIENILPKDHLKIKINYNDDGSRSIINL